MTNREKQISSLLSRTYMDAVAGSYEFMMTYNLTQNTYNIVSHNSSFFSDEDRLSGNFEELVDSLKGHFLESEKDHQIYIRHPKEQLKRYHSGQKHWEDIHQGYDRNGNMHWIRERNVYTEDPESGDIIGVSLADIIDDELQLEKRNALIMEFLASDYTNVYLLNAKKDRVSIIKQFGFVPSRINISSHGEFSYWEAVELYINERVYENDKARVRNFFSLINIENMTKEKKSISCFYRAIEDREFIEFQAKIIKADNDGTFIIAFKRNDEKNKKIYDEITGLFNKEYFYDYANRVISMAVLENNLKEYSIVFSNISNFKYYNMKYGRQAGDVILKHVGSAMELTGNDLLVARAGDDHFISISKDPNIVESIKSGNAMFDDEFGAFGLQLKSGIYRINRNEISVEEAADYAKIACDSIMDQQASVSVYDEKLEAKLELNNYIVKYFNSALNNGWIKVYYQPVVRTVSEQFCGVEALARWIDPKMGLLSPADFIPVLESNGLIAKLDLHILKLICADIREGFQRGDFPVPVSFNLSKMDFIKGSIFEQIDNIVMEEGVPRDLIRIEVTESAVVTDPNQMKETIKQFQGAGYQVWMDDFGSELSSLNMLSEYQFDAIKLDMMFLRSFTKYSKEMIRSIVQMAKRLNIKTVAEGVETEEQYEYLKSIGCEKIQGYYFSKPRPIQELATYGREKNIVGEPRSMWQYYDKIGAIDHVTNRPLAIIEFDENNFRYVYRNAEYEDVCQTILKRKLSEGDSILNNVASIFRRKFIEQHKATFDVDDFVTRDYSFNGQHFRISSKCISRVGKYSANHLEVYNITAQKTDRKSEILDDAHSAIASTYDSVYILSEDGLFFDIESSKSLSRNEFKEHYIFWKDQQKFMEFTNPVTFRSRLEAENRGFINRYFRTKSDQGGYLWKSHSLQLIPESDQIIYSIRVVDILRNELLESLVPSYINEYEEGMRGILTNQLLNSKAINFFWKDKNRRFVGVNRKFLETYGFESDEILIGKTDEEMHWHVDDTPFCKDELDVLKNGTVIKNSMGKCIIKGVLRNIIATKEPVYQNGNIVGLMGYFIVVDELNNQFENIANINNVDNVTGLLSAQGMTNTVTEYIEARDGRREKFAIIILEYDEFERIYRAFGEQETNRMIGDLGKIIANLCGNDASIARLYSGSFSIVKKYSNKKEIEKLVEALEKVSKEIQTLSDYQVTVNPKIHTKYSEDIEDVSELITVSIGGITSSIKEFEKQLVEYTELEEERKKHLTRSFSNYMVYKQQLNESRLDRQNINEMFIDMLNFQEGLMESLRNLYITVHIIDIETNTFMEIVCADYIKQVLDKFGYAQEAFDEIVRTIIKPEYKCGMSEFLDVSTLQKRLENRNMISYDYDGIYTGWCRGFFIPASFNEDGTVKEAMFFTQHIESEEAREKQINKLIEFKLEDIWSTYEELDDIFYAADMDTYELIYMNRKGREALNVAALENIVGDKCYKIIQGKSSPCAFCTNSQLMKGESVEYDFFNSELNMMAHVRDQKITHGTKNIRIEHAVEIHGEKGNSEDEKANFVLNVINENLRLALEESDPHNGIEKLLGYLGEAIDAERTYVFELAEDEKAWTNSYEWCAEGVSSEKDSLQYIPMEDTELWNREFEHDRYVKISNIEKIKESDPVTYNYLKPQNINSLVVFPIHIEGRIYGFIGFDNPPEDLLDALSHRINSVARVFETMLERRLLKERLDKIIYTDEITGLGNRFAVKACFDSVNTDKSIGLVFCDICGLKYVNDNLGHLDGDQLLIEVSQLIKNIFSREQVFRWGGDEILVVAEGMTKEAFYKSCEELKKISIKRNSPVAVGRIWKPAINEAYEDIIKAADKAMYIHKRTLYQHYDIYQMLMARKK